MRMNRIRLLRYSISRYPIPLQDADVRPAPRKVPHRVWAAGSTSHPRLPCTLFPCTHTMAGAAPAHAAARAARRQPTAARRGPRRCPASARPRPCAPAWTGRRSRRSARRAGEGRERSSHGATRGTAPGSGCVRDLGLKKVARSACWTKTRTELWYRRPLLVTLLTEAVHTSLLCCK